MRVLEQTVASVLEGFLELNPKDAFAVDHSQTIEQLQSPVWVGGNDYKTFKAIQDASIVFEVAGVIERLDAWNREVGELRSEYFYEHMANQLPEPFEAAFGFTSSVVFEYQAIVKKCKTLVDLIASRKESGWSTFKTADAKVHRSRLKRIAEEHPDRLQKSAHGIWKVHPEFRSIYFK